MDIMMHTLKSQWDRLKLDIPGIRLARGKELLGCTDDEILRAEFNTDFILSTKEVNLSDSLSNLLETSNLYR